MPTATVNLRHLEEKNLHLEDELTPEDLDLDNVDDLVHVRGPLKYDLEVEKVDKALLVQGSLRLPLQCECARCLKPFPYALAINNWTCHLPLEGEDAAKVDNDVVDLTPYIREDTLLAFPQRPLCEPGCKGLPNPWQKAAQEGQIDGKPADSAWNELDKLKL